MTDSKNTGNSKPARSSARQGEPSVRIPRLQSGGPAKGSAAKGSESVTDEVVDEQPTEVVEVEQTEVEAEEKKAASPAAKKSPAKKSAPSKVAARDENKRPGGAARSGSTMTAADYARTTRASADTTAVIPAIRDEDEPRTEKKKPAARVAPVSSNEPAAASTPASSGRRAELRLVHVEPWSVTKLAFVVSVALMIVSVFAVGIAWVVLDLTGVWDQLNGSVTNVLSDNSESFDITSVLGLPRLVGLTLVLSAINVVVMTALATIGAHLYNLAAQLLGGIHLTFSDD